MSFKIVPAVEHDIARLSRIHVDACAVDNAISLYFTNTKEFEVRVTEMLRGQIGHASWTHMKAVDVASGEIAAWASWTLLNDDPEGDFEKILDAPENSAGSNGDPALRSELQAKESGKPTEFEFPSGLGTFVRAETGKFFGSWMGRERHFQLRALFTDKKFERSGMGTALVKFGNDLADSQQLPILTQASPFGFPIYAANSFRVIGSLDVDLRDWAPNAKGNDRGWGNYRYRFMLREPIAKASATSC
ncbi:MAG: hypothetical protein M1828_007277 [Chrysothrix sp. TS-e1954]|nr:MAG: hypothetical protein M1828_007277 [Chrysothrix sp. TS-e1954]